MLKGASQSQFGAARNLRRSTTPVILSACPQTATPTLRFAASPPNIRGGASKAHNLGSLSAGRRWGGEPWAAAPTRLKSTRPSVTSLDEQPYEEDDRLPVTVITGFLGSGKTTLLNSILTRNHGKRIAIIENEFGEIDIDSELVVNRESIEGSTDSITQLSNGCLCCTVRDDLIQVLNKLWERRDTLDHVIIETTGLANPAPIISSFFVDKNLPDRVKLDGVVTVIDAKFVERHLSDKKEEGVVNEAVEQIAYADRIILNKTDLVDAAHLDALEVRIRSINQIASITRAVKGDVPIEYALGIGGYNLDSVEKELDVSLRGHDHEHNHDHDHDHEHKHDCDDPSCTDESHKHNHAAEDGHSHDHDHDHATDHDCAGSDCAHESHSHEHSHSHVAEAAAFKHDDKVGSISIVLDGDMDLDKTRSEDIFRMKGLLSIAESEYRFVYQGVHMMFEGAPDRKWRDDEKRMCKMVFIGLELDKEAFTEAFTNCLHPLCPTAAYPSTPPSTSLHPAPTKPPSAHPLYPTASVHCSNRLSHCCCHLPCPAILGLAKSLLPHRKTRQPQSSSSNPTASEERYVTWLSVHAEDFHAAFSGLPQPLLARLDIMGQQRNATATMLSTFLALLIFGSPSVALKGAWCWWMGGSVDRWRVGIRVTPVALVATVIGA
eukprot:gene20567-27362_t